jgi:hypothetical protein
MIQYVISGILVCLLTAGALSDADLQMARAVRSAVRSADSNLLHSVGSENLRAFLKMSAMQLSRELQPLLLIRFDEDAGFRQELKELIEREHGWQRVESENFFYYYRNEVPAEVALHVQDAQINALESIFEAEMAEKIPYIYDPGISADSVIVLSRLTGGIRSSQPFDLENTAYAFFSGLNSEVHVICQILSVIYGRYFRNETTVRALYEHHLATIRASYYEPVTIPLLTGVLSPGSIPYNSVFVFVYKWIDEFGPAAVADFLQRLPSDFDDKQFRTLFRQEYGISIKAFENRIAED